MIPRPKPRAALPVHRFRRQEDWAAWLEENHATSRGVLLQLAKKDAESPTVSYDDAVDLALCFGWIDGQKRGLDERHWLQTFTPRSHKSLWSKINREKALALVRAGRMKPAGIQAIERAKADGRWQAAYDSARKADIPGDFQLALDSNVRAKRFFTTLDARNRYSVLFRIQTARKPETRAKRIVQFVQMLERHEKIHP